MAGREGKLPSREEGGVGIDTAESNATVDHRKRPRRRGPALERAILAAAVEELREVGYARLSLERVAARARTGNAVVYRRWSGRAELALDVAAMLALGEEDLPDTGDLRGDILAHLRQMAARLDSPLGQLMRGLFGEMATDGKFAALVRERIQGADSARIGILLERAVARGEVAAWIPASRRASVAVDLLRNHFVLFGAPISDEVIADIVDDVYLPLIWHPAPPSAGNRPPLE